MGASASSWAGSDFGFVVGVLGLFVSTVSLFLGIRNNSRMNSLAKRTHETAAQTRETARETQEIQRASRALYQTTQRVQVEQLLHEGWELLGGDPGKNTLTEFISDASRLEKAKHKIDAALELDPTHRYARLRLGTYFESIGKRDTAQELYLSLIRDHADFADAYYNYGSSLQREAMSGDALDVEKLREAETFYRKVLELDPSNQSAFHNLGAVCIHVGDLDAAEQAFREAIAQDKHDAISFSNLGVVHYRRGDFELAAQRFSRAVELEPEYAPAYTGLGSSQFALRNYDDAVNSQKRAVDLAPTNVYSHQNLGRSLKELCRFDEAITCFETASKLAPADHENWILLGRSFLDANRPDEAITAFQTATAVKNDSAEAVNCLGVAYTKKALISKALEHFERALLLDPGFTLAEANIAKYRPVLDQLEEQAETSYSEVLERGTDRAATNCNMGDVYCRLGHLEEAIVAYREAIRCDPKSAIGHNGLGKVMELRGQCEEAARLYRRAKDLDPRFIEPYINLATLINREGRLDESIRLYREAIDIAPEDQHESLLLHLNLTLRSQAELGDKIFAGRERLEPAALGA